MMVTINLDEHFKPLVVLPTKIDDCFRPDQAVGRDFECTAFTAQRQCLGKLRDGHRHGVENVRDALSKELLCLFQRRYGNALCSGMDLRPNHLMALGRFHMRT
ncbi:hypothetical protein D9M71_758200 [compost metagenome]